MFKYLLVAGLVLVGACASETPSEPGVDAARGGRPGGSAGGISPVALLNHRALGCYSSGAAAVSSGSVTTVTGWCDRAGSWRPFIWTAAAGGIVLDASPGGMAGTAASDDGTTFGSAGWRPYYRPAGGSLLDLPLPSGLVTGDVSDASANGELVLGYGFPEGGMSSGPLAWRWSGTNWASEAVPEGAAAIDGDGDVLAGVVTGHAAVWTAGGTGWISHLLADGGALQSRAAGINDDGTVIAGLRSFDTDINSPAVGEPLAWISDGIGGWTLHLLAGLFESAEGEALAVQTLTDGRVAVVGWLWEDLPGAGEQQWAVAWIRPAGATEFGPPVKLAPLAKGAAAWAYDVNLRGEIVGASNGKGLSRAAVKWQLP